jgi:P4 family phage/plasmid primase-like protien
MNTWHQHSVVIFHGATDTRKGTKRLYETMTLAEVFQMEPDGQPKNRATAMLQSSYNGPDGRTHAVQQEQGQFVCLAMDIDKGDKSLEEVAMMVDALAGVASLIYSSSSAATGNRKWRVIVPLESPVTHPQWRGAIEAFFAFAEARGFIVDRSLARAGQPVYLPNVPPDRRAGGKPLFYGSRPTEGRGLRMTDLAQVASALRGPIVPSRDQLLDDLRSALEFLDPDPYEGWLAVGMALKTAPLDRAAELFHEWSERSDKYSYDECQTKWDSLEPTKTSYKAIFKKAQELGWVNPASGVEVIAGRTDNQDLLAELFAKRYEGSFAYAHDFGRWLEFDGQRWVKDPAHKAFEYARQLCRHHGDGKHATRASFFGGVEQIAKCDPRLSCASRDFDKDTYELNTPSGAYDLRTGEVKPHHPEQRLTKITAVAPTAAHGGVFLRAIREICGGDQSLVRFHQVSLGAMLSGARKEHWLIYWFGTGRNGKNLLADLVFSILGEYAHKLPSSALMSKKYEAHPSELTGLRGVRLALSSEIEEGSFWNEARLKELTGDEFITARYMGKDAFTFTKSHKHLILGNHRPQIKTVDEAIKNRVLLVPFDVSFAGREDRDLPQKIQAEAGFVLHWLIEGHTAWMDSGLPKCEAVEQATKSYFAAQSTIDMWIDECCRKVDERPAGGWHTASSLYESYQQWKRARGEGAVSQTRFGEFMGRTFEKTRSERGVAYVGLELVPSFHAKFPLAA